MADTDFVDLDEVGYIPQRCGFALCNRRRIRAVVGVQARDVFHGIRDVTRGFTTELLFRAPADRNVCGDLGSRRLIAPGGEDGLR